MPHRPGGGGVPVVCPDKLVYIGLTVLHPIVAYGVADKFVHYVQFAGETENIHGKQKKAQPEREGFHGAPLTIKKTADKEGVNSLDAVFPADFLAFNGGAWVVGNRHFPYLVTGLE